MGVSRVHFTIERAIKELRTALVDKRGRPRVFALMSGGVDSSAAALLALHAGLDVTGVIMRQAEDESSIASAARICGKLGIDLWSFDLRDEFRRMVREPFKEAYERGRTPNPCVVCNPKIKFGLLLEEVARRFGRDDFPVVSGHYAKIVRTGGAASLFRGNEPSRDQSYFLCKLPSACLQRLFLPIGAFTKERTREIVRTLGDGSELFEEISSREDSMEICFMKERDGDPSLSASGRPGRIVDQEGRTLGLHDGIAHYTIGQRRGLGIASKEPLFVTDILPESDTLVVGDRESAMTETVDAEDVNVLAPDAYAEGAMLTGKIRSQGAPTRCLVQRSEGSRVRVVFEKPLFAPAPGQYLVLYDGERLVAGGVIVKSPLRGMGPARLGRFKGEPAGVVPADTDYGDHQQDKEPSHGGDPHPPVHASTEERSANSAEDHERQRLYLEGGDGAAQEGKGRAGELREQDHIERVCGGAFRVHRKEERKEYQVDRSATDADKGRQSAQRSSGKKTDGRRAHPMGFDPAFVPCVQQGSEEGEDEERGLKCPGRLRAESLRRKMKGPLAGGAPRHGAERERRTGTEHDPLPAAQHRETDRRGGHREDGTPRQKARRLHVQLP